MFKYTDQGNYQPQQPLDYRPLEQEKKSSGGLTGLTELIGEVFGNKGGGEAALKDAGRQGMGQNASLAAAEQSAEQPWSMSNMFGGRGEDALADPWTALAAVMFGNHMFGKE